MVWESAVNAGRLQALTPLPDATQFQATGFFRFDFLNACTLLGIEPHPFVRRGLTFGAAPSARPPSASAGKPAPAAKAPPKGAPPPPAAPVVPESEKLYCVSIDVRGFELDAGTVHALSLALPACTSLQSFKMFHVGIEPALLQKLCDALSKTSLHTFHLDDSAVSMAHVEALRPLVKSPVRILSIRMCALGDAEVGKLIELWKSGGGDLNALLVSDNQLSDACARSLADFVAASKSLHVLSVARSRALGDVFATAVAEAVGRRPLDAAATAAARKQIEEAKRKKGGEAPPFEEVGSAIFGLGNRTVQRLDLAGTGVGVTGVQALLTALEANKVLADVVLTGCPVALAAASLSEPAAAVMQQLQSVLQGRVTTA